MYVWFLSNSEEVVNLRPIPLVFLVIAILLGVYGNTWSGQQVPRIGVLVSDRAAEHQEHRDGFLQSLTQLGYSPGGNISIEHRYADGNFDRLPALAAELIQLQVSLIVAGGPTPIDVAMKATAKIPIVMANGGNPVTRGFVKSLSLPGGNVTGLSSYAVGDESKRLELLKEAFPRTARVVLLNTDRPTRAKEYQQAGRTLGLDVQLIQINGPQEVESGLSAALGLRPDALLTVRRPMTEDYHRKVSEFAIKSRLPSMHEWKRYVQDGGLMSYGISYLRLWQRAAVFVDKILKGADPATLPVEPPQFEFVINLQTATKIGVTIPPEILLEANEVIK